MWAGLVRISAIGRMRSLRQYLMYLIRGCVHGVSISCCIIERSKDVGAHSSIMSMTVRESKHRISPPIDSQRLEVNTSAGMTRYWSSSDGIACDRGSPCSAACSSHIPETDPSSPVTGMWAAWAACFPSAG